MARTFKGNDITKSVDGLKRALWEVESLANEDIRVGQAGASTERIALVAHNAIAGEQTPKDERDIVQETVDGVAKYIALNDFARDIQTQILRWRGEIEAEANGKVRDPEQAPFDDPNFAGMFFVQSAYIKLIETISGR